MQVFFLNIIISRNNIRTVSKSWTIYIYYIYILYSHKWPFSQKWNKVTFKIVQKCQHTEYFFSWKPATKQSQPGWLPKNSKVIFLQDNQTPNVQIRRKISSSHAYNHLYTKSVFLVYVKTINGGSYILFFTKNWLVVVVRRRPFIPGMMLMVIHEHVFSRQWDEVLDLLPASTDWWCSVIWRKTRLGRTTIWVAHDCCSIVCSERYKKDNWLIMFHSKQWKVKSKRILSVYNEFPTLCSKTSTVNHYIFTSFSHMIIVLILQSQFILTVYYAHIRTFSPLQRNNKSQCFLAALWNIQFQTWPTFNNDTLFFCGPAINALPV